MSCINAMDSVSGGNEAVRLKTVQATRGCDGTCQFGATLLRLRVERLGGRHGLRQLLRGRRLLLRVELELPAQLIPQPLLVGLRSQKMETTLLSESGS